MNATDRVRQAWRHFADGDRPAALRCAQQAVADDAGPSAAAALGYFLLDANQLDAAAEVLGPALRYAPHHAPLHWYAGLLHQRRGETAQAIDALRRACQLDERLDEAATTLAWLLQDAGELTEALHWAAKALQASRQPPRLLQFGWLLQRLGHLAEAVDLYQEAVAGFPFDAPEQRTLHLHLAQCHAALHRPDQAGQALERGLERLPFDAELITERVLHEWAQGRHAQAIGLARAQMDAHPERPDAWYLLGVLQQRAGDLDAADRCFAEVQQRDPANADALLRRAQIQSGWGRAEATLWLADLALQQRPDSLPARALKAQALLDLKRTDDARRLLLSLLRTKPEESELWRLLAAVHGQRRRGGLARRALARALRVDANNVTALRALGWLALEQGDLPVAKRAIERALECQPGDAAVQTQAAFVLAAANELARAADLALVAVAHDPKQADAWRALAEVRLRQRRLSEAETAIETALLLLPDRSDSLRQLGWILLADRRPGQALLAFLRIRTMKPDDVLPLLEMAEACLRMGDTDRGLAAVDEVLGRQPGHAAARLMKARLLAEGGTAQADELHRARELCRGLLNEHRDVAGAAGVLARLAARAVPGAEAALKWMPVAARQAVLRDALSVAVARHGHDGLNRLCAIAGDLCPLDPWMAAAALYAATLSDTSTPAELARDARDLYRMLKLRGGLNSTPRPPALHGYARPPRIAYVAGQQHQSLLRRVLAAHDGERAEVFLFSNLPQPGLPAHIHCEPLRADTLAAVCAANRIDVLIDAGGLHPFEGQFELLEAYARRVAPLQVGWLGCPVTGGGLFDALLTDERAVPVGHEAFHEEALWRIEGGQWCWDPPVHAPQPLSPPVLRTGAVTFGVTARGLRMTEACIDMWAQVLVATPHSSIRFIGEVADDGPQRAHILAALGTRGVAPLRVAFDPPRSYNGLLDWLQQIDLLLDSFPGNGGLSLLDPLWMGVPVISRAGDWAGARQGLSVLASLGLDAWVADSAEAFVGIATALAGDVEALRQHRGTLRARMAASPLLDGRRVARQIEQACERFVDSVQASAQTHDPKAQIRARARRALHAWLDKAAAIDLPEVPARTTPDLSVIVVLYKQAGLTRTTLQALADQRGVAFETVIVDNASDDETGALLQRVRGAHIVRNAENTGFLRAANQAAALARGRHLVFLNSDAILQQGALAAALAHLDAEPDTGVLGGRIVLTAGGLQEAGNTIFRDGSTLGIGRGEDPFCPAAMARRATDYVSGVFMAVRTPLWHMLGGFDERYAPAYYEDTDFCLRVWRAGFRVVYEPAVLVEHLEWGSATGDEVPQQMCENRRRFVEAHDEWLRGQGRPAPQPLDGDRWHSPEDHPRRPRVLILDNEVPHMVKGGGLPRARLMLHALRDWPVTFYPLWQEADDWRDVYASLPPCTEVALGWGMGRLESFLELRRDVYDVMVVSRPPNLKALSSLRQRRPDLFAGIRLIYDAEALFALREIPEAAVKGRPMTRAAAQARLAGEIALANGVDQVWVVSARDGALFQAAGHRVRVLSHAIPVRRSVPGPLQRSGLLFVGAMHPGTPNEDGLVWFVTEVMPRLRALLPQAPVLSVVGMNHSGRVSALACGDVHILGPQAALEPFYDRARVFIAPVRFSGGVPLKVIEAAAQGVPVVASAVLLRQLGWTEGIDIQSGRDADAFARGIVRLLKDDALWVRQQQAAWAQCQAHHDPERFGRDLRSALDGAGAEAP
ncbi:tetratricopeptide repeat protein [Methyloversatilis thermotolerans]|uniref:tetratricopeptide repeat protein n=1 Tax=Methyloversatilis thermotolerans TaxID=1346290 RepID=UPI000381EBCC|nr:tetratricopeptide repeat protein [Methyloversatilis thermotolerans]